MKLNGLLYNDGLMWWIKLVGYWIYHSSYYPSYLAFHCDNPLRPAKFTQDNVLQKCVIREIL